MCHILLAILLMQGMLPNGWMMRKAITVNDRHSSEPEIVKDRSMTVKDFRSWSMQEQMRLEKQQGVTSGPVLYGWKFINTMPDMTAMKLKNRRTRSVNGNRTNSTHSVKNNTLEPRCKTLG